MGILPPEMAGREQIGLMMPGVDSEAVDYCPAP
jgi:hypothetical protein